MWRSLSRIPRKGYFRNTNGLKLTKGDLVAVEATQDTTSEQVSLVGQLVLLQMKKNKIDPLRSETKKIYRIAAMAIWKNLRRPRPANMKPC